MFSSGCRRGVLALAGGSGVVNPRVLFASGEQGGWWDPSDLSTLFQDSAGTTPVTAAGQSVGLVVDKSGRGNNISQATAGSRPTLQVDASGFNYLSFDGVDDGLSNAGIDLTGTNKVTIFAGAMKSSDAATGFICEHGQGGVDARALSFSFPRSVAATGIGLQMRDGTNIPEVNTPNVAAPVSYVITASGDYTGATVGAQVAVRINGALPTQTLGGAIATGSFGSYAFGVGRRPGGAVNFNGRIYALILRGAASDAATVSQVERFIGARMGVSF